MSNIRLRGRIDRVIKKFACVNVGATEAVCLLLLEGESLPVLSPLMRMSSYGEL